MDLLPDITCDQVRNTDSQGNSLVVQWLGLCAFTAEGPGSIPGQGTKIPQIVCQDYPGDSILAQ